MSIKFVSAILGPEMAAPILWTPGKNAFFLQGKPVSIKFRVLGGGGNLGLGGGGGEVPILFLWARGFFWITSFDGPFLGFKKSRSRGKDEKIRQEKAKMRKMTKHSNVKNPHTWCGGFSGPFFTIKLGTFWNFDLFLAHWLRLWPKKYISKRVLQLGACQKKSLNREYPKMSEIPTKTQFRVCFLSECAKGAERASCGETVVQKGVLGESAFFSASLRFALKTPESLRIHWENCAVHFRVLDGRFSRTTPSPLLWRTPIIDFGCLFSDFSVDPLAHRNRSDFCDCDAHRGPQKSRDFRNQETAMMHCDLRVRWKVASDLRFRAAISEPKTPSCCGVFGDLAPSTRNR